MQWYPQASEAEKAKINSTYAQANSLACRALQSDGGGQQGNVQFVVAGQAEALPLPERRALEDVLVGTVVPDHVEIGGHEPGDVVSQVLGDRKRLQEDFRKLNGR